MDQYRTPDLMPVLSRGRHRTPRKGACFMELASFLAGERWSDHPACTHPLLAKLAREVNDHVGDAMRARLAPLAPAVVGLTREDPRVDVWIARDAALLALPVVSAERQTVAACALVLCEEQLARLEGREPGVLPDDIARALDDVPHARDRAMASAPALHGRAGRFTERSAPAIVHASVSGISEACVPNSDEMLYGLLERTITKCQGWFSVPSAPLADRWPGTFTRGTARGPRPGRR